MFVVILADFFIRHQNPRLHLASQKPHAQHLSPNFLFGALQRLAFFGQFFQIVLHGQPVFGQHVLDHAHDFFIFDGRNADARLFRLLFDEDLINHPLQKSRLALLKKRFLVRALIVGLNVSGIGRKCPVEFRKCDHFAVDDGDDSVRHAGGRRRTDQQNGKDDCKTRFISLHVVPPVERSL